MEVDKSQYVFPQAIAFNSANSKIYVTNFLPNAFYTNTVSVIDGSTDTVIKTINVGRDPVGITVDPYSGKLYVTNQYSNTVSVINGSNDTVIGTIPG